MKKIALSLVLIATMLLIATIVKSATSMVALVDNICDIPKNRAHIVDSWNQITDRVKTIDAYNFQTKAYNSKDATITCEGTIEDGYGDKYKVRFKQYKNSFGELVVGFEMID